ncbi:MAG: hypothetical protein RBR86_02350 [Pseudobdellovibrionaceae bacterium]|jgi:hypothetical protein|nr:hypothetical protein [Pseudobdellovibrionaceae bacterium]
MQVNEKTIPLYTLMSKLTGRSHNVCHTLFESFEKAKSGDPDAQYDLAFGLHTIVPHLTSRQIDGFTDEVRLQTLAACLQLFQDVASGSGNSHRKNQAAYMVQLLKSEGICEPEVH